MQKPSKSERVALVILVVLIAGVFIMSRFKRPKEVIELLRPHIHSIIELSSVRDTSASLVVGYNYDLLEKYASDNNQTVRISVGDRKLAASYSDALRNGAIDILVIPYADNIIEDSILVSAPIDSTSVWLMRSNDKTMMRTFNKWMETWKNSEDYTRTRNEYIKRFNALKSTRVRRSISPYDDLIKKHASALGWDWRLLAALMYQESRFHIDARSRTGAGGLMQMMPSTAKRYGVTDWLDPEMNVEAGARLLGDLMRRYSRRGANTTERFKYAIAAYNAGTGRVDDCINYARYRGVDTGWWINVAHIIPEMNDEKISETGVVKLGPFKGTETIRYVDSVVSIYNRFCKICPE